MSRHSPVFILAPLDPEGIVIAGGGGTKYPLRPLLQEIEVAEANGKVRVFSVYA